MKMPRNVLRKMELRIYQAIAMEETRKNPQTETQQKLSMGKAGEESAGPK